ncbi:hypothetical protein SAMN05216270_101298 [Glycomyces harbinensis]|uniref:Uncharacterized protein n=1 Tax=Glycomyces harbinensis TaxID=58114 RepID=A0A1G6R565_9ACTN|nr:hypothetical protein SAMN05216270_101298 [Glycomyces harbinensis]
MSGSMLNSAGLRPVARMVRAAPKGAAIATVAGLGSAVAMRIAEVTR